MRGLTDKIALVTGGSAGIGQAAVQRLVEEGCKVAFLDLQAPEKAMLSSLGNRAKFYQADITDEARLAEVAQEVEADFGPVSLIVSNAAAFIFHGPDAPVADFEKVLRVNVIGASRVVHYFLPQIRKNGGGAIAVISSVSGFVGQEGFATYTATKFSLRGLVKSWAVDLAKDHIRVNSICPGCVQTKAFVDAVEAAGIPLEQAKQDYGKCHLLNRIAAPSEVASVIAFALSEEASFMTGSDLVVDGGYLASVEKGHVEKQ